MTCLCIDLGTTRLKVALVAADGTLIAQRSARIADHAHDGRSWQCAQDWWQLAGTLAQALTAGSVQIRSVSLSGRGGAAVFVDADAAVIADPWSDTRHADQQRALRSWRPSPADLSNYAAALLAKAMWLREQQPHHWARVRHVLYAKDFLLLRLTGQAMTDPSSGPDAPMWPDDVLRHLDIDVERLPCVAPPWHIAGGLTRAAARHLGLRAGIPVAVGAHDGICANIGCGAASPGAWALTLGTHAVVRVVSATAPAGARRFYGLPEDRHVIGGNAWYGGRAADWFADLLHGADEALRDAHFARLEVAARGVPPGADGVSFAPFLGGRIAPQWQPHARAAFTGLQLGTAPAVLYRAVLEGVAFALRDIVDELAPWCGTPSHLRLTGGGAQSALWCELLADVLDVPLEWTGAAAESTGAAIIAAVARGHHVDIDAAVHAMVRVQRRYLPDARASAAYAQLHDRWRAAQTP